MFASIVRVTRSLIHGEVVIWPAVAAGVAATAGSLAAGSLHLDLSVEVALASMTTFLFGVLLAFTIARDRLRANESAWLSCFLGHQNNSAVHQFVVLPGRPVGCSRRLLREGKNRRHIVQHGGADGNGHGEFHDAGLEKISASEWRM